MGTTMNGWNTFSSDSTRTTWQDHISRIGPDCPIRVAIMERNGNMSEVWLPVIAEGRYTFDTTRDEVPYPVYIQAEQDHWTAVCVDGAWIEIGDQHQYKAWNITSNIIFLVHCGNREFVVYSEGEAPGDNVFIPYYIEHSPSIRIGRDPNCDIVYANNLVSRYHAELSWVGDHWIVTDTNSTNSVYLNDCAVYKADFQVGDSIYIMGLRIIMGVGYVAINNGGNRVRLTTPLLRLVSSAEAIRFTPCPKQHENAGLFNRMPRKRDLVNPDPIEIEAPPQPLSNRMPMFLRLGSPLISGGRMMMTGNILNGVISLLMPLLTQGYSEKDRKQYETLRTEKYREYLAVKEAEIREEINREQAMLNYNYPDLTGVLDFANNRDRLWERQHNNDDFLNVRLGSGKIEMLAEKHFPKRTFQMESDPLEDEMYTLTEKPTRLMDAPVMLSLREDYITGILGSTEETGELLRNIIIQLAMTHSYDEVKMVLLDDNTTEALDFTGYLPHFWDNDRTVRYIAHTRADAQQLSKQLNKIYETYNVDSNKLKSLLKSEPAYIIIVRSKELLDAVEVFKEILTADGYRGISLITAFDNLPKECTKIIRMDENAAASLVDLAPSAHDDVFFQPDQYHHEYAYTRLHKIMDTKLPLEGASFALPNMITFLDMYNAGKVEHLNPLKRWEENNPVKSLAAPLGIGTDGRLFTLDLHEKKQGPHGLVAGGTGSGKSEFIITYILSMAVNYSPDEVAFVLIDYKGGGLADAFVDPKRGIHLPHVVATITNLDGGAIQRSLVSINSELKRRQAVFSKAKSDTNEGTMDIYDYQKLYRAKRVSEPMPHLFIISDEFAELKKQQPEFMDELISTARIGRSLGVHLILATQKPAGVVNDQIWSNTKFRICLRVADKSDSMEMLKRPEAAELRNTGRFYLQVGYNELFAQGQSAWCGAGYEPKEVSTTDAEYSVQFLDTAGQVILDSKPEVQRSKAECKQIVAIVQYLSDLAKREGITPRSLWKDPLPSKLELAPMLEAERHTRPAHISALIGTIDDPAHQKQFPMWLDLQGLHAMMLIAGTGMGKSSFMKTMLYTLIDRYSPEELNYYIVDLSGGALNVFRKMPHCGAYLSESDEADFFRLMAMMREMAAERKKLFAKAEVTSFDAYLQVAKMPLVLMVIDSFHNIMAKFAKGSEVYMNFSNFIAEIAAYGIHVILTANHSNEVNGKCKQEIDYRVVLAPKDKYEANEIIEVKTKSVPNQIPGRGVCVSGDEGLEFHVATLFCDETEQTAIQMMREKLSEIALRYSDCAPARKLPVLDGGQTYREFVRRFKPGRVPFGYYTKDMKPVALPLRQMNCLPLYFGNPHGVRPVLENFFLAAAGNGMEIIAFRRNEDSQFSARNSLLKDYPLKSTVLDCSEDSMTLLSHRIMQEITCRNEHVNAYSDLAGIPRSEKGRAKKAAAYVMEHTQPLLIFLESINDFIHAKRTQEAEGTLNAVIGALKGYNIYFIGCTYPEDQSAIRSNSILTKFVADDIFILFGGRYQLQALCTSLPTEYRKMDKPNPNYDRCVLRYKESWYDMLMPCGTIEAPKIDPDEAPIV